MSWLLMAGRKLKIAESRTRWLLISFLISALLLLLLVASLLHTQRTLARFESTHIELEHIAGELLFHIQGLQTSAMLAASTGDLNWRQRHRSHRRAAHRLLGRVGDLASTAALAGTLENLRERLDEAEGFYREVFNAIVRGDIQEAEAILKGWPHVRNRKALRDSGESLSRLLREDVRSRLAVEQRLVRSTVVGVAALSAVMLLCWYMSLRSWSRHLRQRQEREAEIRYLSYHDELTGLQNRRGFIEAAEEAVSRSIRYGRPLSALLLDVDHFKQVNDTYGHAAGDRVLSRLARVMSGEVRDCDVLGRLGGEEFGVLLPETGQQGALQLAERIRERVAEMVVDDEGYRLWITVSIGVAGMDAGVGGVDGLLRAADDALYTAKNGGRDRVVASEGAEAGRYATAGAGQEPAQGARQGRYCGGGTG